MCGYDDFETELNLVKSNNTHACSQPFPQSH